MRIKSTAALVTLALIAAPVGATGCFGSFGLTRTIWEFNDGVASSKLVKWLVFLGLNVIPVYEVAAVLDALIFNSLEFWTGSNPMAAADGQSKTVQLSDGTILQLEHDPQTHAITTRRLQEGRVLQERVFVPEADGMRVLDGHGETVLRLREDATGAVELRDAEGALVARHGLQQVDQLHQAYAQQGASGLIRAVRQVAAGNPVQLAAR